MRFPVDVPNFRRHDLTLVCLELRTLQPVQGFTVALLCAAQVVKQAEVGKLLPVLVGLDEEGSPFGEVFQESGCFCVIEVEFLLAVVFDEAFNVQGIFLPESLTVGINQDLASNHGVDLSNGLDALHLKTVLVVVAVLSAGRPGGFDDALIVVLACKGNKCL